MKLRALREEVCAANAALDRQGLVTLTWGNVSGIERGEGLIVIKPSGVPYAALRPDHLVVTDLTGRVVEGELKPSSDLPTHLALYQAFGRAGGITHAHSACATAFAQAGRPIPCFGTTHADHFHGEIPLTRALREAEIRTDYEHNTGRVIVERFADLDPWAMPGVLVAHHGPFTWGPTPTAAVENSVILEAVARMALHTLALNPAQVPIAPALLDRHYLRKHGPDAYYGQPEPR